MVPEWYTDLPVDDDMIYSSGAATAPDLQLAVDIATLNAKAKLADCEGYIRHLQYYLRHGDYCDDRYGAFQEKRIKWKTIVPKG